MSDTMLGVQAFVVLFGLMVFRIPVAFAMLVTGYFGMAIQGGFHSAGAVLVTETHSSVTNYSLIAVPMFAVMLLSSAASMRGCSRLSKPLPSVPASSWRLPWARARSV